MKHMPNHNYKFVSSFLKNDSALIFHVNYSQIIDMKNKKVKKIDIMIKQPFFMNFFPITHSDSGSVFAMINSLQLLKPVFKLVNIFFEHISSAKTGYYFEIKQLYINLKKIQTKKRSVK